MYVLICNLVYKYAGYLGKDIIYSHIYLRVKVDFFHRVMVSPQDAEGEGLQVSR